MPRISLMPRGHLRAIKNEPAVYLLYQDRTCLYVGASLQVKNRISGHPLQGEFDRFQVWYCDVQRLAANEAIVYRRVKPIRNRVDPSFNPFYFIGLARKRSA